MTGTLEEMKGEELEIESRILVFYLIWSALIAVAIIVAGVLEFLITGNSGYKNISLPQLLTARGNSLIFPFNPIQIIRGVIELKSFAIIQLGVILLLFTPFGRIFLQILIFAREKDRAFTVIAATVFVILLISLYTVRFLS